MLDPIVEANLDFVFQRMRFFEIDVIVFLRFVALWFDVLSLHNKETAHAFRYRDA